jgi:hypothetical protein
LKKSDDEVIADAIAGMLSEMSKMKLISGDKRQTLQSERQKRGYPKVGDKIVAIKSGNTHHIVQKEEGFNSWWESHVTKGKQYIVEDNGDFITAYLHIQADVDKRGEWVLLTESVLKKFFGIKLS